MLDGGSIQINHIRFIFMYQRNHISFCKIKKTVIYKKAFNKYFGIWILQWTRVGLTGVVSKLKEKAPIWLHILDLNQTLITGVVQDVSYCVE